MSNATDTTACISGQINLACFALRDRLYAIDVCHVREIVRCQPVTPLPKAPELIEGVVDLRGAVVPVIDLGRALGGECVAESSQARIVVIGVDGLVLGLRVEAAVDVLSLEAESLEDPPALAVQAGYDAIRAVVRRDGGEPVMVLSLEHLLESVGRSGLGENAA
jgi:purine-binding chemotaxis protein CheW